jgi:S1-C subfamily serine protease
MRRIALLFLASLVLSCHMRFTASSPSDIYSFVAPSIVKVERLTGGSGSGFYVQGLTGKLIITNAHVCDGAEVVRIIPSKSGEPFNAVVKSITYDDDLCAISAPDGDKHPALELAKHEEARGNAVYAVGHPVGAPLTVTMGILVSEQQIEIGYPESFCGPSRGEMVPGFLGEMMCVRHMPALQTTARIMPGNSGGPLVNAHGEVVGVDFATDDLGGNALPLSLLQNLLLK